MRFVVLWIKLKLGTGVGDEPTKSESIFSKRLDRRRSRRTLTKVKSNAGIKGHTGVSSGSAGVKLLRNALWLPDLVGRTPDRNEVQCWGHMPCMGQLRSTRGHIAQECPVATKFGRMNPWPKCSAMLGLKVIWGQMGVNRVSNCLEIPYSHQRWLMPL